jgi:hypothetical protein
MGTYSGKYVSCPSNIQPAAMKATPRAESRTCRAISTMASYRFSTRPSGALMPISRRPPIISRTFGGTSAFATHVSSQAR